MLEQMPPSVRIRMEQMLLLHIVHAHTPPADSCLVIGAQKLAFCRRRKCPFDTLSVPFVRWYLVALSCVDGCGVKKEKKGSNSRQLRTEKSVDGQNRGRKREYLHEECSKKHREGYTRRNYLSHW
jgi:hypothetical protein